MRRGFRARLSKLDQHRLPHNPPVGRLLFLLPDLWPAEDQGLFHTSRDQDEVGRWWERDEEVDPETINPSTRLVLLRYRATDEPQCA